MKTKIFKLAFIAAAAFLAVSFFVSACATSQGGNGSGTLVLLHTNDHHGRILPTNDGLGGLAQRATFIDGVRLENGNVLLVDGGDINTGPALSNMFDSEPDIIAYNLMGYDAVTFGNHEFNKGLERLDRQMAWAKFPFVSSNIRRGSSYLGGNRFIVKDYDGFRVGIIGLTTRRTLEISRPTRELTFQDEIQAARSAVNELRRRHNVDIIIALSHLGDVRETSSNVTSIDLARQVQGIDIIVDGHSHSIFAEPLLESGTWIVTANEWGKYVGKAVIEIENGSISSFNWEPILISGFEGNAAVTAALAPFIEMSNESLTEVIGSATSDFDFGNRATRYIETAIGGMIADANVWYLREEGQNLDFAFHNGGGIRANLSGGNITREDVLTVLPFDNYLYVVSMTGAHLKTLFDFIGTIPQGNGAFPQFSREVRYELDIPSQTVRNLTIGGAALDPNRVYRFSTNDFVLSGGDGYTALENSTDRYDASILLSHAVTEYIKARTTPLVSQLDGRLVVIGGAL